MKAPDAIEKITGNSVVQIVASGGGLLSLGVAQPLAAILPTLLSSAANTRMQSRINEAFEELEKKLSSLSADVASMNDGQYKFVCDTFANLVRTNEAAKIAYLKNAVINGVQDKNLDMEKAYIASRVLRDISALEIDFLFEAAKFKRISIATEDQDGSLPISDFEAFTVANNIKNQTIINGLRSLGLVEEDGTWNKGTMLTPVAFSLITLLQ